MEHQDGPVRTSRGPHEPQERTVRDWRFPLRTAPAIRSRGSQRRASRVLHRRRHPQADWSPHRASTLSNAGESIEVRDRW